MCFICAPNEAIMSKTNLRYFLEQYVKAEAFENNSRISVNLAVDATANLVSNCKNRYDIALYGHYILNIELSVNNNVFLGC